MFRKRKMRKTIKELNQKVAKLQFDLDTLKEFFYKFCKFCEHWHYQAVGTGRCANCPEFDSKNNAIENTGSEKFAELTTAIDSCNSWELMKSIEGREKQLTEKTCECATQ